MNKLMIFLSCFIFFLNGYSQFSTEYINYKKKYPQAHLVRLNESIEVDIKLVSGELLIEERVFLENIFLSQSAKFASKKGIGFSSFSEIEDIKASVVNFEGDEYVENHVRDFITSDEFGVSFYDDLKKVEFTYLGIEEGSKTRLFYTRIIKDPRFLSRHYFGDQMPMISNSYQVTIDKDVEIDFKKFSLDDSKIEFSKDIGRKRIVYKWQAQKVDPLDVENDTPNYVKQFPHIIPLIKEYTYKDKVNKISGSLDNLYEWYYSLVKGLNEEQYDSSALEKTVEELTRDKSTEIEKVKAIYYWVQENIKYVAFEYALGGFVPRNAFDVYNKKYGDCKDNSSILKEMLKIAGIRGNLTWIGTRDIPYTYTELPTPAVDNHMILSYVENDKTFFLDATGRYMPLDMPTSFIQGKEALIGINEKEYRIEKVPIVSPERNTMNDSVYLTIDKNRLNGKGRIEFKGYPKVEIFNVLESISNSSKLKEYYKLLLKKGNNRFLIDEIKEVNKFDYKNPYSVEYVFNVENYIQSYENEHYINMNVFSDFSEFKTKDDREQGKEYRYQNKNNLVAILEIPNGLEVVYIPEGYSYSNDLFDCKIEYKMLDDIHLQYTLFVKQKFIALSLEEQRGINQIIKEIEKHYKDVVVLKEKK